MIHVLAAEFVSAQRPKGDILLFRRARRSRQIPAMEIEKAQPIVESNTPDDFLNGGNEEYNPNISLAIEKQNSILTWSGLKYDITVDGKVRRLLDEVDGWVKPGTLTALMVRHKPLILSVYRYNLTSANVTPI